MVKSQEERLLPLSNDIETLVKQVMSRVKNNYYQGMSLEQCPDFDTPLEPITIAKISPWTKYHNIYTLRILKEKKLTLKISP